MSKKNTSTTKGHSASGPAKPPAGRRGSDGTSTPPAWVDDPQARLERKNAFDASLGMGTANFNRTTGRLGAKSRPFLWAMDEVTGLIRSDLVRPRDCPICGTPPENGLFVKDGFRHVKCAGCGLVYVSLVLKDEVMDKYWREELAWSEVLTTGPQMELDRLKFQYGLDLAAARLKTKSRRLLDVGSGPGGFVRLAAAAGWDATALELNEASSRQLAAEGYKVIVKQLELSDLDESGYDLISFWEVLEHLTDPAVALASARRLLAPGGLMLIMVPNVNSLVTRLLHEKSNTFGGHSHLNHFNQDTLERLVRKCGLETVEMETVITELGTINNHLAFEDPYAGRAPTFAPGLTPAMIHDNFWGSRLLALAEA